MARSLKRSFGFAAFGAPLLMVLALSACGDDDGAGAGGTVVEIKPSTYLVVTTNASSTTVAGAPTGEPGDTSPAEQSYEVQSGDFLSGIAADFEIEMDEIANFNNWADGTSHPLHPGDVVRIPPGAVIPSAEEEEPTDTSDDEETDSANDDEETETTEDDEDPELCPDGEPRGHYTVKQGDIPARVAASLDVTLDQLNDANANTQGYSAFIVGIEILIPCGAELEAADTTET